MKPRHRQTSPELTDAEIEAIVANAIAAEAAAARSEPGPPSSAIVWWRAQTRARREAAQLAEKPIAIVHGIAVACGVGVAVSLLGIVIAGMRGSLAWLKGAFDTVTAALPSVSSISTLDFGSPWITLSLTVMLVSVVLASVAALLVLADE